MKIQLNTPYAVKGADLQEYFEEHGAGPIAKYQVDSNAGYSILVWFDSASYEHKKKLLEPFKKKGSVKSASVIDGDNFYTIMFSPVGKEELTPHPGYQTNTEVIRESGISKQSRDKAMEVLNAIDDKPQTAIELAKKTGVSESIVSRSVKAFLAQGLIVKAKVKGEFGKGRMKPQYVRKS